MEHDEIESLLGAYALDAVDADEVLAIEAHLSTCPRCRAELAAHREVAALLGNSGSEAPLGLWDRIATQLGDETEVPAPAALIASLPRPARRTKYLRPALAAAAVVAIALLSLQVANLNNKVDNLRTSGAAQALAPAVSAALAAPHATIMLTSAATHTDATVIVGPDGSAYWVSSDLPELSATQTYQVWGLVHSRIVSLGLLGSDARRYSAFRVQAGTTTVMVTVEPEGGTSAPTSDVVLTGAVHHLD